MARKEKSWGSHSFLTAPSIRYAVEHVYEGATLTGTTDIFALTGLLVRLWYAAYSASLVE